LAEDRKLSEAELVRAIRFVIAAEYEAVQLYTQLAESIDDEIAVKVLKNIADEEKFTLESSCDYFIILHQMNNNSTMKVIEK